MADTTPAGTPDDPNASAPGAKPFDVGGTIVIQSTIEAPTAREAIKIFLMTEGNEDADVDFVGSRTFIGLCEDTGTPILDGDDYREDGDNVFVLVKAVEDLGEDEKVFEDEDDTSAAPAG